MSKPTRLVLAIDVGGTKTAVAAVERLPEKGFEPVLPACTFGTPRDPDAFLQSLARAAGEVLPQGARPVSVGMGIPGPLDPARGMVESSPNIGWRALPIARLVSDRFGGIPVVIEDDANCGALGEALAGAGRGADPYAYLPLGTGLGGGIVVGGRILDGAHGASGEIGHMAVGSRVGPRCSCRRRNCVEAWCAGAGLGRRAREIWPSRRLADGSRSPRDASDIFSLARTGDAAAVTLVRQAQHALAVGIAAVLATVDPAVLTVGGTIGRSQPAFVRAAFDEATRLVHVSAGRAVRLRQPALGDASVLCGAAVLGVRGTGDDRIAS